MAKELKKQLYQLAAFARWLPLALPYRLAQFTGASRRTLALLLPPPRAALVTWIDLASITLETTTKKKFPRLSFVWPGNWDREQVRPRCSIDGGCHEDSPFKPDFDTVRDLCVDNRPLEHIAEYQRLLTAVKAGKKPRGCKSPTDIEAYFNALKTASHSIATQGYKASVETGGNAHDEIGVWITRDGQIAYGGWGNHRLAIADLHKIDQVTVKVLGAHPDWLIEQCRLHSAPPHEALFRAINRLQG